MKVLLVCAGGMSTGLLMKKMEAYAQDNDIDLTINAVGLSEYEEVYTNYDIVLVGPQVSYRLAEIKENTKLPCDTIPSLDYAVANCANIMKLATKLYESK